MKSAFRDPHSAIPYGLLPYQSAFAANNARFKIGLWARQTGKDHTCAFEAVADSIRNPGTLWLIVAASERQALESLDKAKQWAEILQLKIDDYTEEKPNPAARLRSAEIKWSNGSRLLALPANPQTIRGYSANIILTEFAFHENPHEIWRAIYPSISNPLRGGPKKLRIISTPNGLNNKFANLWHNALDPNNQSSINNHQFFHTSLLTIHDAIAAGLPLNAEELRAGLNDEDAWNQEYLCQFADSSSVLLPYDLIEAVESSEAATTLVGAPSTAPHFQSSLFHSSPDRAALTALTALSNQYGPNAPLYAGIDFGRKHHLTVCWLFQRLNQKLITREVLTLKNMSTPDQLDLLRPRLRRCHRAAIDYTGAGVGLGDHFVKDFGEWQPNSHKHGKVELCQFTSAFKAELFPRLRAALEKRELLIPPSREIREDLHAIQRFVSVTGQITYRAVSTPDGHSDRCTALALALRAAQSGPQSSGANSNSNSISISRPGSWRRRHAPRYLRTDGILARIY